MIYLFVFVQKYIQNNISHFETTFILYLNVQNHQNSQYGGKFLPKKRFVLFFNIIFITTSKKDLQLNEEPKLSSTMRKQAILKSF